MNTGMEKQKHLAHLSLRQVKYFSLLICKFVTGTFLTYSRKEMFNRLVTFIMLLIASANVTLAGGMACDMFDIEQTTSFASSDGDERISSISSPSHSLIASQHSRNDNCGDTSKHPQANFHHCHFGHCAIIVTFTKFSPHVSHSEYGFAPQNFALKSFIANLFRPPIA